MQNTRKSEHYSENVQQATMTKGRCHKCPRKKDNKTHIRCNSCDEFVCGQHATKKYPCADVCADYDYTETENVSLWTGVSQYMVFMTYHWILLP